MNGLAGAMKIRSMVEGDLDHVLEIANCLPDAPHWARSAYADALNPASIPRRLALVAAHASSGQVAGFAVIRLVSPQAELESIAVASNSQRQGVGQLLFEALADELAHQGVETLILEVRASNLTALAFYRSLGFVQNGLRPRYYVDPIEDAVLMVLRLKA